MQQINLSDTLQINIEKAFYIISSIEFYPEFVPGYRKVILLEKNDTYIKAEILPTIPIKNILMEAFLIFPYEIRFRQIKGPLDIFEGIWSLEETDNNEIVKVKFNLNYFVKKILIRKLVYKFVQISFKDIIASFKIRAKKI